MKILIHLDPFHCALERAFASVEVFCEHIASLEDSSQHGHDEDEAPKDVPECDVLELIPVGEGGA